MPSRLKLQTLLENILDSRNVYFQPPESINMEYPCIIYNRSAINTIFADNKPYVHNRRYTITVIDKDPDSCILDKLLSIPTCTFDRHFTKDNLNHDVFSIYY